jgi:hypothetical protein
MGTTSMYLSEGNVAILPGVTVGNGGTNHDGRELDRLVVGGSERTRNTALRRCVHTTLPTAPQ